MDESLKSREVEHAGRRFDIRVFLYDGGLLEAAPFENGRMAEFEYPGGTRASPLYQLSIGSDGRPPEETLDSLIDTAEDDIRRRVQ